MLEVSVDSHRIEAKLHAIPALVRGALQRQVAKTAVDLQRYIVREHLSAAQGPSDTQLHRVSGRLARSIQQRTAFTATTFEGRVFSAGDVPYAKIHEYGGVTGPHIIRAKNVDFLKFTVGGNEVFRKQVNHPGSKIPERSYMRASLRENKEKIVDDLTRAVKEGVKK